MARNGNRRRNRSVGPTGEQHFRTALASGDLARCGVPLCDLCALLREATNRSLRPHHCHGLRIALVDDDEDTRLVARETAHAQRDGWTLEVYHPCCLPRAPSHLAAPLRRPALKVDDAPDRPPEIVLIGLMSSELSRLTCVRRLKALSPALPVVVISDCRDATSIVQCCMAGASGYLIKPVASGSFGLTVKLAAQGRLALCRESERALMDFLHRAGRVASSQGLTAREREIMIFLAEGLSDKEIARRLDIATNTAHVHLTHLFRKLGVHSRRQAAGMLHGGEI
jgi:two-component system, NarL family, nitrate/nitrite response regulator NarL